MKFNFDNSYGKVNSEIVTFLEPDKVSDPKLFIYNDKLGRELDVRAVNPELYLSGRLIPEGSEPLAMAYSGHQFGFYNVLGDGRAILLGEHIAKDNKRFDIHLKGSGRTPYSRGGDGRGTLSSMVREYIISYGMERLGIPTTRTLAVVESGDMVYREEAHKGGILTRVARSHIRVGTFEFVAMQKDINLLRKFTDYTINRLYPQAIKSENPYLEFYRSVIKNQIELIVNWMRVGFIHGVMNTDNMAVSGETIDYGPCAFMDRYNPDTVFSSIDRNGRYSYGNQEYIGKWNLARLGECLIPLINSDTKRSLNIINNLLEEYDRSFNSSWVDMMSKKLGFDSPVEIEFIRELLASMVKGNLDYTKTFRELKESNPGVDTSWYVRWRSMDPDFLLMDRYNPAVIPRNHIVEGVLSDIRGGLGNDSLEKLLKVLDNPYLDSIDDYYRDPPGWVDPDYKTYCGT